jgi:hypothetical protein
MTAYINTGFYLKALSDDLVGNLHRQLTERGYGEIRPSHGMVSSTCRKRVRASPTWPPG